MNKIKPKLNLSKSLYTKGLQCKKALWLKKYNPEVLTAPDDIKKAIFEAGNMVGGLACELFPDGKEVQYTKDYEQMIRQTKEFMDEGVKDIFEATFLYDSILVMVDILHQNDDGSFEIYEVKSSTWNNIESTSEQKKKLNNYTQDASIQYYVLNGLGLKINEIFITLLSKNYIRKQNLDHEQLFHHERVTEKIIELQPNIPSTLKGMREVIKDTESEPAIDIGSHCKSPYQCDAYDYCWKTQREIPDYSVFNDFSHSPKKSQELYSQGITAVKDIPDDFSMTELQQLKVDVWKNQNTHIEKEKLKEFVNTMHFPIYYFDFETISPPVPEYQGESPFNKFPFQYSLHIEYEDGKVIHKEVLENPDTDGRENIARKITEHIPKDSCVVAFNSSFEMGVFKHLANHFPQYEEHLKNLHGNFVDLWDPFKNNFYVSHKMRGLHGIKTVLPALVPDHKDAYKNLDLVKNGSEAMYIYKQLGEEIRKKDSDSELISRYRSSLKEYCKLDTFGMVQIVKKLRELI
ncbi:DUF2779 domain-containing protein [Candidatus Thioglobus sp.]|nr:DUF2779 domain-containing protein [Candidatus Thioglobus sp.]